MNTDPDRIAELAADIADGVSGSRLHGVLAGGLCCGTHDEAGWERVLDASIGALALAAPLRELIALTAAALGDPDLGFEPVLPDEYEPLAERVAALADWCDGFVLAFAAGRDTARAAGGDDDELLADLNAIAGGLDAQVIADAGDDDEDDFMQLVEYVRVAALSLFAARDGATPAVRH